MTTTVRWIGRAVFIAMCLGAGGLGAIATTPEIATCKKQNRNFFELKPKR